VSPPTGAGTGPGCASWWSWCLLLLFCALGVAPLASADPEPIAKVAPRPPDLVLRGELTGTDNKTWHAVPFDVPEGVARLTVEFDYTTRELHTAIDIGIQDPEGFRGWSGGDKRGFTLSATDATPSYLSGPMRAGRWSLLLGVPNIRPQTQAQYTANVWYEKDGAPGSALPGPVLRAQAGWYRGDLHMHTAHSDGSCLSRRQQKVPCPLFLTATAANERGLDFIAITDHNTPSHANAMRELQPYFDDLLLIPGREITTFYGHANVFGTVAPLDFRVGSDAVPDVNALLKNVERTGAVISINHPVRPIGEECMGCGWAPRGDVDYALMQAVEVVNGRDADTPLSGISFWEGLLNKGYRLTAVGGSDNHNALGGTIGVPTTVVYADELSQAGISAGLRRGRVYVDVTGAPNRTLEMTATAGQQRTSHMGDVLLVKSGTRVQFEGRVGGVPEGQVEVIVDGRQVQPAGALSAAAGTASREAGSVPQTANREAGSSAPPLATPLPAWPFTFPWRADSKPHWIRVNVRDGQSHLALVGNPIYVRPSR
jgi:hypothetical protein